MLYDATAFDSVCTARDLVDSKHADFGKKRKKGEERDLMCVCGVDYAVSEMCEEISICWGAFFTLQGEMEAAAAESCESDTS